MGHKKKSSFMNLFGKKKDLAKELEVEAKDDDDEKTAKIEKTVEKKVVSPVKSMPPPKASKRKKPVIPKDDVVVPKLPPRPPAASGGGGKVSKPPKAPGNGSGLGSGGNDAWSAYIAKFGNTPSSASQLQSFSKTNADVPTLNFRQARDLFKERQ